MDAEERHLLAQEYGVEDGEAARQVVGRQGEYSNGSEKDGPMGAQSAHQTKAGDSPHKKPNMFAKWLRPDKYTDYATMRRLVPKDIGIDYPDGTERDAYFHPAVTNVTPLLWIPRDPMGVSRQECADTSTVIPITDEGAFLDEKNTVVWDAEDGRPPIYQEKIYY